MSLNKVITNQSELAIWLMGKFLPGSHKNVVFSPVSVYSMIGLLSTCASDSILKETFNFGDLTKEKSIVPLFSPLLTTKFADGSIYGGPRISFANSIWVDNSIELHKTFEKIARSAFKTTIYNDANFQLKSKIVRKQVDFWAEKETQILLEGMYQEKSSNALETRVALANALFFNGSWAKKFNESVNRVDDFYTSDGKVVQVPFMTSGEDQHVTAFDGFKVLKMYYRRGTDSRRFSMYIYLPDAKDGLDSLVKRMCSGQFFINRYIPGPSVALREFKVPKFEVNYKLELCQDFKEMGLQRPFSPGGIKGMVKDPELGKEMFVKSASHKAFIKVSEEQTEAAGVSYKSCGGLLDAGWVPRKLEFVADHPFVFMIKDRNEEILFVGTMVNPLEN